MQVIQQTGRRTGHNMKITHECDGCDATQVVPFDESSQQLHAPLDPPQGWGRLTLDTKPEDEFSHARATAVLCPTCLPVVAQAVAACRPTIGAAWERRAEAQREYVRQMQQAYSSGPTDVAMGLIIPRPR